MYILFIKALLIKTLKKVNICLRGSRGCKNTTTFLATGPHSVHASFGVFAHPGNGH